MDNRAFECADRVPGSRAAGPVKDAFQISEPQNEFPRKHDNQHGDEGEQRYRQIRKGSGEGLHVSHDASLSIGLAGADVAEGLGVA